MYHQHVYDHPGVDLSISVFNLASNEGFVKGVRIIQETGVGGPRGGCLDGRGFRPAPLSFMIKSLALVTPPISLNTNQTSFSAMCGLAVQHLAPR